MRSVVPSGQAWGQSSRLCFSDEATNRLRAFSVCRKDGWINLLLADGMIIDVRTDF